MGRSEKAKEKITEECCHKGEERKNTRYWLLLLAAMFTVQFQFTSPEDATRLKLCTCSVLVK
jgi:hypothetical protein